MTRFCRRFWHDDAHNVESCEQCRLAWEQQFNALRCIPELLEIVAAYNRNPEPCHFKIRQAIQHAQICMSDSE